VIAALRHALRHAGGRALPGQARLCGLALVAWAVAGGALALLAIAVLLALEP
jgi:hypothetical protein